MNEAPEMKAAEETFALTESLAAKVLAEWHRRFDEDQAAHPEKYPVVYEGPKAYGLTYAPYFISILKEILGEKQS